MIIEPDSIDEFYEMFEGFIWSNEFISLFMGELLELSNRDDFIRFDLSPENIIKGDLVLTVICSDRTTHLIDIGKTVLDSLEYYDEIDMKDLQKAIPHMEEFLNKLKKSIDD